MKNENLNTALTDLVIAIRDITLGSVECAVIEGAGKALIFNWNDHNEDKIDVVEELLNWERFSMQS